MGIEDIGGFILIKKKGEEYRGTANVFKRCEAEQ